MSGCTHAQIGTFDFMEQEVLTDFFWVWVSSTAAQGTLLVDVVAGSSNRKAWCFALAAPPLAKGRNNQDCRHRKEEARSAEPLRN